MIVSTLALKGGVGKTTTAIHVAAYLQSKASTLLVDADPNRSSLVWAKEEKLPFKVVSEAASPNWTGKFKHILIDTKARPSREDMQDIIEGSDLLILPTTLDPLDIDATMKTVNLLEELNARNYKILLTKIPPRSSTLVVQVRKQLAALELPVFKSEIKRFVCLARAALSGVVVREYPDAYAKEAWACYQKVGKEILP